MNLSKFYITKQIQIKRALNFHLKVKSKSDKSCMSRMSSAPKLLPLFDRVIIKKAKALSKTKGGIVIPEEGQTRVLKGTVVAVGPGSRNSKGEHVPVSVKVGDSVLLPEYGGRKLKFDDADKQEMHIYKETDLLAKLEN